MAKNKELTHEEQRARRGFTVSVKDPGDCWRFVGAAKRITDLGKLFARIPGVPVKVLRDEPNKDPLSPMIFDGRMGPVDVSDIVPE